MSAISDQENVEDVAEKILAQFRSNRSERTLTQLMAALPFFSVEAVVGGLRLLLKSNKIVPIFRVISPFGENHGIRDFADDLLIPPKLVDIFATPPREFKVSPSDIRVVYRRRSDSGR